MVDPNPMGGVSLLESLRKNVGIASSSGTSKGTVMKTRRRIRRKIMILIMSVESLLKRMVEMTLL